MTRNEEIMKAIREQNITPHIEEMMREDINKTDSKRINERLIEMFKKTNKNA